VIVGDKNTFGAKAQCSHSSDCSFASRGASFDEDGALKLTIQKLSVRRLTQLHCVAFRLFLIFLPSLSDPSGIWRRRLKNAAAL